MKCFFDSNCVIESLNINIIDVHVHYICVKKKKEENFKTFHKFLNAQFYTTIQINY